MSETMIANIPHTRLFTELLKEVTRSSYVQGQTVPFGEYSVCFLPLATDLVYLLVLQVTPMQNCTDNFDGKF